MCNIQPISFSTGLEYFNDNESLFHRWDKLTRDYLNTDHNQTDEEKELVYNRLRLYSAFFENIGDEAIQVGHQPKDFLLHCLFSTEDCSPDNFTWYQSPTYYNCYTFNGGNLSEETLKVTASGPQQGLSLILYLENDNGDDLYNGSYHTLSNIGDAGGVRVSIHSPYTRPSPVDKGFDIPPGYSSSVGVRAVKTSRLGAPYGECEEDLMRESSQYIYSTDTCMSLCQQSYIATHCHCLSSLLPTPETSDITGYKYCGYYNASDPDFYYNNLSCEAGRLMEFSRSDTLRRECQCFSPCQEYDYIYDVSYSYWPLDFTQASFYDAYVLRRKDREELKAFTNLERFNNTQLIEMGLIRRNFVRLNIYMKDLMITDVTESRTYKVENLFSDIGGTFGLWIGVSVLTWCEISQLFVTVAFKTLVIVHKKINGHMRVNPTM